MPLDDKARETALRQFTTGDHILYIGEVVGAGVNGEGEPFTLAELGWHCGG